jgi:phosphotransferase system enzyme I (PtsP)
MRGNVGFPETAIGRVSLRVGEGITGMVAECMTTASVAVGYNQAQFKPVPGLPERDFPCFVGIPLRAGGGVCGVLVLQRRDAQQLTETEIALATALAAPFVFALESERNRSRREGAPIRLTGTGVCPGVALGRSAALPSLGSLAPKGAAQSEPGEVLVHRAFERVRRELGRTARKLGSGFEPEVRRRLSQVELILSDTRMESALVTEAARVGVAAASYRIALRYAHAPYKTGASPSEWLLERSKEREALCVLLRSAALGHDVVRRGAALLASRLTGVIALAAASRGVVAVAVEAHVSADSIGAHIARAAGIPVVAGLGDLLARTPSGERLMVDADAGEIRLRPSATEIARIKNR